jgi:hypothetical protein
MTSYADYLAAVSALATVPRAAEQQLAEIETEHGRALKAVSDEATQEVSRLGDAVALVEATLAQVRSTLEAVDLQNTVPQKVRPGRPPADPAAVLRSARQMLDGGRIDIERAVAALQAQREQDLEQRRQEFLAETERRKQAERERTEALLRAKEEAQREAREKKRVAARRRQLIRWAAIALVALAAVVLIVVLAGR